MDANEIVPETIEGNTTRGDEETNEDDVSVDDPWHGIDEDYSTDPRPAVVAITDTEEAVGKLKVSTSKLGNAIKIVSTDLNERMGLSKGVDKVTSSARQIDESHNVSGTVKGATSKVGGWLSSIDQRFAISDKTRELSSSINESVVQPLSEKTSETFGQPGRVLKNFDETHGITRSTATSLASGAEFLTSALSRESEAD